MRVNDYLSVLMCQLNMTLDCNSKDEYLVETESVYEQIGKAFKINNQMLPYFQKWHMLKHLRKNISVFPSKGK